MDFKSANRYCANGNTLAQKWDSQCRTNANLPISSPNIRIILFAHCHHVMNMDYLLVEYGPTTAGTTADRPGLADRKDGGDSPIACHLPQHVALDAIDLSINGLAYTRRILRDHI